MVCAERREVQTRLFLGGLWGYSGFLCLHLRWALTLPKHYLCTLVDLTFMNLCSMCLHPVHVYTWLVLPNSPLGKNEVHLKIQGVLPLINVFYK